MIKSDIPGATLECSWRFQVAEAGCHDAPLSSIFADLGFSVGQVPVESSLSVQMAYLTIFHVGMMAKNTALKVVGFIKGLEPGRAAWLLIGPRRASFWEIPEARALGGPTVHVYDGDSCMFGAQSKLPFRIATNIPQLTDVRRSCCKLEHPHEHTGNMSRNPGLLPLSLFDVLSLALARQIAKSQLRTVGRHVSGRLCSLACYTSAGADVERLQCNKIILCPCSNTSSCSCHPNELWQGSVVLRSAVPLRPLLETQGWPDPPPLLESHFHAYHDWISDERKRPVNVDIVVRPSWRLASGRWACSAGSQMRRTATPPLIRKEVEPGVAIKLVTSQAHPFSLPAVFHNHWQPRLMSCAIR